jgi:hypothetical protein
MDADQRDQPAKFETPRTPRRAWLLLLALLLIAFAIAFGVLFKACWDGINVTDRPRGHGIIEA